MPDWLCLCAFDCHGCVQEAHGAAAGRPAVDGVDPGAQARAVGCAISASATLTIWHVLLYTSLVHAVLWLQLVVAHHMQQLRWLKLYVMQSDSISAQPKRDAHAQFR